MTDTFNVTSSYDKASYNKGDTITATISGNDVLTNVVPGQSGAFNLTITAADGSTTTLNIPSVAANVTTTLPESVRISGIVDSSGRAWTISPTGLSATAVA